MNDHLLTKQPKKILLSSVIQKIDKKQAIQLEGDVNLPHASEDAKTYLGRTMDYQIGQVEYKDFFARSPHGKVHIFKYKEVLFTLVGTQYSHMPLKNIYKLLINAQPDLIVLQMRPDYLLGNFKSFVSRPETPDKFSSTLYFDQITRQPEESMPSSQCYEQVQKELLRDNIILQSGAQPSYDSFDLFERIPNKVAALTSLYAQNKNIPIVMGDLPEVEFRNAIAYPHTLLQLQNMFNESVRQCAQNPDIEPNTPLNLAYRVFPHVFLQPSDSYITTLIEYLAQSKRYKRVCLLLGDGQSDAVTHLLDHKKSSHFQDELTHPLIKGSILKDTTQNLITQRSCEDLLERHAILDVMHYGVDLLDDFKRKKICYLFFQILLLGIIREYQEVR